MLRSLLAAALLACAARACHGVTLASVHLVDLGAFDGTSVGLFKCLVLTDRDDGAPDTLRTALGDPRCGIVALAGGLRLELNRTLTISRSVALICAPHAAPLTAGGRWDSTGGARARAAFSIPKDVSRSGATLLPAGGCVLDGNRTVSVLRITGSRVKVNVSDVSIVNGFASVGGGGLDVDAPSALVILDHVSVFNNSAGTQGGGARVRGGAALVSLFSLWANNTAGNVGGALVANASEVAVQNSVFVGNSAVRGGAVFTTNTDLQVHFSLFANNSGGAVAVGPQLNDQASSITFTHFVGNRGVNGSAIEAYGANDRRLRLTLSHDAFEGNNATGFGGAVASSGGVSTVATACSFVNNRDSCDEGGGKGSTVYLDANPDLGCTDVFTAVAQAWPLCAQWRVPVDAALVRRSTTDATCLPLPSSPLGPFCCEHSLVPLFCSAVPKVPESNTCE